MVLPFGFPSPKKERDEVFMSGNPSFCRDLVGFAAVLYVFENKCTGLVGSLADKTCVEGMARVNATARS